jgi:hypothetical protein
MSRPNSLQQFFGGTTPYHPESRPPTTLQRVPELRESSSGGSSAVGYDTHRRQTHQRNMSGMDHLVQSLATSKNIPDVAHGQGYMPTFTPLGIRAAPMPPSVTKKAEMPSTEAHKRIDDLRQLLADETDEPQIERATRPSSTAHIGIASFIAHQPEVRVEKTQILPVTPVQQNIPQWFNGAIIASTSTPPLPVMKIKTLSVPVIVQSQVTMDTTNVPESEGSSENNHNSAMAPPASLAEEATVTHSSAPVAIHSLVEKTIIVGDKIFVYDAQTVTDLYAREPTCSLFTRSSWNLEPRSFREINNWICGYGVDKNALKDKFIFNCFTRDVVKLNMPCLEEEIKTEFKIATETTESIIQQFSLVTAATDVFAKQKELGFPSFYKAFNRIFTNNPELITHMSLDKLGDNGNPLFSLILGFFKNIAMDSVNSPFASALMARALGTTPISTSNNTNNNSVINQEEIAPSAIDEYIQHSQQLNASITYNENEQANDPNNGDAENDTSDQEAEEFTETLNRLQGVTCVPIILQDDDDDDTPRPCYFSNNGQMTPKTVQAAVDRENRALAKKAMAHAMAHIDAGTHARLEFQKVVQTMAAQLNHEQQP